MTRIAAAALLLTAATAHAGGQFLPVRGVRPAARGGAFVAGADDPGALWYNPAGLAELLGGAKMELLLDAALVGHDITYTRVDSGGNVLAPVSSSGYAALTALKLSSAGSTATTRGQSGPGMPGSERPPS